MAKLDNTDVPVAATIAAANVAGELYRAGIVARSLSLAAKNSRAMVLRAGSQAAGLQVISGFFAELAATTISLSKEINVFAVKISNNSVSQWRNHNLVQQLAVCSQRNADNEEIAQVTKYHTEQAGHTLSSLVEAFHKDLRKLENFLEEIESQMRASSVIAVNFRLEATQTGEFQPMLNHMAANIDQLSNQIKQHVETSQRHMRDLKG